MKLKCSKCYQELTVNHYDIGIFVDECENCKVDVETVEEEACDNGFRVGALEELEACLDILESLENEFLDIDSDYEHKEFGKLLSYELTKTAREFKNRSTKTLTSSIVLA